MYDSQITEKRIRKIAEEQKTTVNRLLIEMGLSQSTVRNMRKSEPRASVIAAIAEYLGVSTDYLLGLSDEKEPQGKTVKEPIGEFDLANILSDLSYSELKRIKNYIDYLIANK